MQSEVETPLTTALPPSQDQVLHYTLPTITDKPIDVAVTITSEPEKEIESSPYEEETPTQTPGPLVAAEASGDPEEVESSGIDLESSVPPQEDAGEVRPLPPQQEDLSQHLGPVLEEESSPNELEQPAQLSEFLRRNFQGNDISYIDKNVWKAYRWAEKLLHKDYDVVQC
ncbi:hypothetical protein STEG23_035179 [Scotinomys teguina]